MWASQTLCVSIAKSATEQPPHKPINVSPFKIFGQVTILETNRQSCINKNDEIYNLISYSSLQKKREIITTPK